MGEFEQLKNDMPPSNEEGFEGWRKREVSSYKEIVLKQIETCRAEGSKMMVGGGRFWDKTEQGFVPVTLFDQKKIFTQCVLTLHDLMLRYFDNEVKINLSKIQAEIQDKRKNLAQNYIQVEPRADYKQLAIKTGTISASHIGSQMLNNFDSFLYNQHRKMFQELLLLFDRKHELSSTKKVSII